METDGRWAQLALLNFDQFCQVFITLINISRRDRIKSVYVRQKPYVI